MPTQDPNCIKGNRVSKLLLSIDEHKNTIEQTSEQNVPAKLEVSLVNTNGVIV